MKTYELVIDPKKEKVVVDFLKQLDFVKIKKKADTRKAKSIKIKQDKEIPYFGATPNE